MGLRDNLKKAEGRKGVFYQEHPTRKHGVKADRLFVLRYRIKGKEYVSSFGWASEGKTELQAEQKLIDLKAQAKEGTGPASIGEEREEARAARQAAIEKEKQEITVEQLIGEYIERHAKRKKRTWEEDERALNKDILPVWGKRKAKDIKRTDAANLLESIAQRAPVQACNVLEKCRKMFNCALQWGYVEANPFTMQPPPAARTERERTLSDDEIRTLWTALDGDDIAISQDMRRALKLILITGQRPGEVMGMHHREIKDSWWEIPKDRAKNKRAHRVYLTKAALDLIGKGKGYVFPSKAKDANDQEKPIAVNAMALCLRRNIIGTTNHDRRIKGSKGRKKHYAAKKSAEGVVNRIGIEHFTPHDLRRTFVTNLARFKIQWEVRERIVNHKMSALEKTYNKHDYETEKMVAMQKWQSELDRILTNTTAKIVNIR